MYCPRCHAAHPGASRVCVRCGTRLTPEPPPEKDTPSVPTWVVLVALAGVFSTLWIVLLSRPTSTPEERSAAQQGVGRALEAVAINRLRTLRVAQEVYRSWGSSNYTTLECLVEPRRCSATAPEKGLLDPTYLTAPRLYEYRFEFHAGPAASFAGDDEALPPHELEGYAYVAQPIHPAADGPRAFCVDSTRPTICAAPNGTLGPIVAGRCPGTCRALDERAATGSGVELGPPATDEPRADEPARDEQTPSY